MFGRDILPMLVVLAAFPAVSRGDRTPVEVSLTGVVHPTAEIVTLADVAGISGGDLMTRRKIAALDIAKIDGDPTTKKISKRQVSMRILLAGVSPKKFRVTGAENVLFKIGDGKSQQNRVLESLRPGIARRLGVDPADVQLRLTRPIAADLDQFFGPGVRLDHFLPPAIRPGPMNVRIGLYEGDRLVKTMAVSIEVLVVRKVFVAKRHVESGTTLSADDVVAERRMLSGQVSKLAAAEVVGRTARKKIRVGAILSETDLQRSSPARKEIVIRSRDVVEVVAHRKNLQVKISGAVALQQGAIGDVIRVKNPSSQPKGRVFTARVVDTGVVEIRL